MTGVFLKVLELSLVGSYVMVFVLAVRLLLHICKASRWSSYLLWGIVFLRLILPVVPDLDFSLVPKGVELPQSMVAEVQESATLKSKVPVNASPTTSEGDKTFSAAHDAVQLVEMPKTSNEANNSNDGEALLQVLAYLWLAGVI